MGEGERNRRLGGQGNLLKLICISILKLHLKILFDAPRIKTFWNDNNIALNLVTQGHLSTCFLVLCCHGVYDWIIQQGGNLNVHPADTEKHHVIKSFPKDTPFPGHLTESTISVHCHSVSVSNDWTPTEQLTKPTGPHSENTHFCNCQEGSLNSEWAVGEQR